MTDAELDEELTISDAALRRMAAVAKLTDDERAALIDQLIDTLDKRRSITGPHLDELIMEQLIDHMEGTAA